MLMKSELSIKTKVAALSSFCLAALMDYPDSGIANRIEENVLKSPPNCALANCSFAPYSASDALEEVYTTHVSLCTLHQGWC